MEFSLGLIIEGAVALLLALTIGYCVILNRRLVQLHADRDALRLMVGDLVTATGLANQAIKELKIDGTVAIELEYSPDPSKIVEWVEEAYTKTDRLMKLVGLRG